MEAMFGGHAVHLWFTPSSKLWHFGRSVSVAKPGLLKPLGACEYWNVLRFVLVRPQPTLALGRTSADLIVQPTKPCISGPGNTIADPDTL